jgi:hypothetical protein
MRRVPFFFLLFVVSFFLPACASLAQLLGAKSDALAPAYSGVGVVVLGHDNETRQDNKSDQSGATGSTASSSAQAEQTQTVEIGQEAVQALLDAAQAAIAAGNPAAASGILGAAQKIAGGTKKKGAAESAAPTPAAVKPEAPPAVLPPK